MQTPNLSFRYSTLVHKTNEEKKNAKETMLAIIEEVLKHKSTLQVSDSFLMNVLIVLI